MVKSVKIKGIYFHVVVFSYVFVFPEKILSIYKWASRR